VSKPSLVIVVVEDDHHQRLVYRYLKKTGLKEHAIRVKRSPSGTGSAENWVRKQFVAEVSVYRARQVNNETRLIVVTDADARTVQDRLTLFDQALKDAGKQTVEGREKIARLVPKRNIETWILRLNDQAVDEETDYKKTRDDWSELILPAAEALFQWTRPKMELPDDCTNSLRSGVRELNRLGL
jgi:hypothetical protein